MKDLNEKALCHIVIFFVYYLVISEFMLNFATKK